MPEPGQTLSHYKLIEKIGEGGMGVVYRAHDERLDRDVAVKVLPQKMATDPDRLRRFKREAKAVATLSHPNILEIHDFDTEGDVTYAVTELLEGQNVREHVQRLGGPLQWKRVQEIGAAVADGLGAAHGEGVVHRDIKPSNIFLCTDGRVKILDFGLAVIQEVVDSEAETESIEAPLTREGSVMGTVGYMAPEQVRGQPADHRSDIFALGCVLYEMLTGERAFKRDTTAEIMTAILREEPPSFADYGVQVIPDVAKAVQHCLEKNPERRFQSAVDLAFALGSESEVTESPVVPSETARDRRWTMPMLAIAGVLVVALGLVFGPGILERLGGQPEQPPIRSIAILPLENLTGDPEQAYFVDGIHEELIATFAQISAFEKVIARTSVMRYRDSPTPIREIGKQLGVDAVIEGSVRRSGDTVRTTLQLIDIRTESHLWAENYQRELTDILVLQSDIAQAVANAVQLALTPDEEARLAVARPINPEAQEAYFRALFHLRKQTEERLAKAIELFEQAIEIDPEYAPAYAGLADSYSFLGYWGVRPPAIMRQAKEASSTALQLNDTLVDAHISLGLVVTGLDRDWAGAEAHLRRAIELEPNSSAGHIGYSRLLAHVGRFDQAIVEARRAVELDPLSLYNHRMLGSAYYYASRHDDAIDVFTRVLEENPDYIPVLWSLFLTFSAKGMHDEALDTLERFLAVSGWGWASEGELEDFRRARAASGWAGAMACRAGQLEALARRRYVAPAVMALVHAMAGHRDEMFVWLEKADLGRDPTLVWAYSWADFDPYRDDPRFQDLVRRMDFPEN